SRLPGSYGCAGKAHSSPDTPKGEALRNPVSSLCGSSRCPGPARPATLEPLLTEEGTDPMKTLDRTTTAAEWREDAVTAPHQREDVLRELHAEHGRALFAFARRLAGGDRQWAEDVVQETMLRAWRSDHPLDEAG